MKLLKDTPLLEDESENRIDSLGFSAYAGTMTDAILGTEGPFAIAILGEWGTGKTSLMRMIRNQLDKHHQQDSLTVWFNAWRYEGESHPIVPLVRVVAESAAVASRPGGPFADALGKLSRGLRAILRGLSFKAEADLPLAKVGVDFDVDKAITAEERLTGLAQSERQGGLEYESIYAAVYSALERSTLPEGKRIVVFLDDVDRCLPAKALQLLESLKLVFGQKGYVFVLGIASAVLEGFLDYQYRQQYGITEFEGRAYLDKVIQMQFRIPPHDLRMDHFTRVLVGNLPAFKPLLEVVQLTGRGNPRATIRFINSLIIDASINGNLAGAHEGPAIDLLYFAMTRALQTRWRSVYDLLLSSPEVCEGVAKWTKDELPDRAALEATGTAAKREEEVARAMLAYPDLAALLLLPQGKQWLTNRGPREAAATFLIRLARDEVRKRAAPDKLFDAFLSYRMTDKQYVGRIAKVLSEAGMRVAWDADLTPGTNWRKALDNSLRRSRALLFFFGPQTPGSEWQTRESSIGIEMATADSSFRLIPILLPGADASLLSPSLREYFWVDLRNVPLDAVETDMSTQLDDLILALKRS
ncbi:MAG: P-loop NTPase fold protein [Isosphaeraceae bacterium]|nr:P-loop NTPase fold protein [Isosphaeraceae bacterium]